MKELLNKFIVLEQKLSQERGKFTLFALFLREDAVDKWDLVVAAPWIDADRKDALNYIANQIRARFKLEEFARLSRVVIVDQNNPGLDAISRVVRIEHGVVEDGVADLQENNFFGLQMKQAHIITSRKPSVNAEVSVI